jgi:hypothetical protein
MIIAMINSFGLSPILSQIGPTISETTLTSIQKVLEKPHLDLAKSWITEGIINGPYQVADKTIETIHDVYSEILL